MFGMAWYTLYLAQPRVWMLFGVRCGLLRRVEIFHCTLHPR